jgi:membrane protein required for colicin V production
MTQFDLLVLALLAISAGVGFLRGAAREVAAFVALIGAALIAVLALTPAAAVMRHVIHTEWLAAVCALLAVFLVAYVALRLTGGAIAGQIQKTQFVGALDRSVGLAIGLARGLLVLGVLDLMFVAATPEDLRPHWIVGAVTWPLAQDMGAALKAVAPRGLTIAERITPQVTRRFRDATQDPNAQALDDRLTKEGYDARQRREIEDLVEKSR